MRFCDEAESNASTVQGHDGEDIEVDDGYYICPDTRKNYLRDDAAKL